MLMGVAHERLTVINMPARPRSLSTHFHASRIHRRQVISWATTILAIFIADTHTNSLTYATVAYMPHCAFTNL